MTAGAERAAIVANARDAIRAGSGSLASASRLLDPVTRERSWLLHAWCRACDADGRGALDYVRSQSMAALAGRKTGDPAFDALRLLAAECAIPPHFVRDHLEGCAMDARGWQPRSEADLLAYCYHAAGAAGCMLAVAMGVDPADEDLLDRASDLGIAFRLATIARDLSEDDAVGRCYVPLDWLMEFDTPPGEHMRPLYRSRMGVVAHRLAALARRYADSGRSAVRCLPFRSRWAVLSAANIHGAIAREVGRRGEHAWDYRVLIGRPARLIHTANALREAQFPPKRDISRGGLWTRPRA